MWAYKDIFAKITRSKKADEEKMKPSFMQKKIKKTLKIKQRITKESQNTNTTLNTAKTKDKNVKIS